MTASVSVMAAPLGAPCNRSSAAATRDLPHIRPNSARARVGKRWDAVDWVARHRRADDSACIPHEVWRPQMLISGSRLEGVAGGADGADPARMLAVLFDLGADPADVLGHGGGVLPFTARVPDLARAARRGENTRRGERARNASRSNSRAVNSTISPSHANLACRERRARDLRSRGRGRRRRSRVATPRELAPRARGARRA